MAGGWATYWVARGNWRREDANRWKEHNREAVAGFLAAAQKAFDAAMNVLSAVSEAGPQSAETARRVEFFDESLSGWLRTSFEVDLVAGERLRKKKVPLSTALGGIANEILRIRSGSQLTPGEQASLITNISKHHADWGEALIELIHAARQDLGVESSEG